MQFEPCTASHWEGLPNYGGTNWTALYTDGGLKSFLCPRYFECDWFVVNAEMNFDL